MSTMTQSTASLPAGTWQADTTHSTVGFEVDYVAGVFRGLIEPFDAKLDVAEDGAVQLEGSAQVSAVQVRSPQLAGHLQSPDFFDAERTPLLRFVTGRVDVEGDRVRAAGRLTIRGIERAVELTGSISGPTQHFMGHTMLAMQLETTIDRTEFGLGWNQPLPGGGKALADEVRISADLYFTQPSEA